MTHDAPARSTFRDRVRASVEPLALVFGRLGLTPNSLTLIGFVIAVVGAWLAATQSWLAAGLVVLFGAAFDMFDGALARATNKASRLGAFMDSTFDRAGEAVVYVGIVAGLAKVPASVAADAPWLGLGPLLAAAAMAAAFMVSYARAKSEGLGFTAGRGMASVGLAPREVRTAILGAGLIGAGIFNAQVADFPAEVVPPPPVWWIVLAGSLGLIAILATFTVIQRIVHVVREARRQEQ